MNPTNDVQNPVEPAPTPGDVQPTPTKPGSDTDWKAAYQGIQPVLQKRAEDLKVALQKATELAGEVNGLRAELTTAKSGVETTLKDKDTKIQQLEQENKTLAAKVKLHTTIEQEFPALVGFSDLIPPTEDEAIMKQRLTALNQRFTTELQTATEKRAQQMVAGVVPGGGVSKPAPVVQFKTAKEWPAWARSFTDETKRREAFELYQQWAGQNPGG